MILTTPKLLVRRPHAAFMDNGAVAIRGGVILAVGPASAILKKFRGHRTYRFENAVLMPGLVNAHTHLELPPLLEDIRAGSYADWVMNLIDAKKKLAADEYRSAAGRNIQELLKTGTTTAAEICTHEVSPDLLKRSGLRGVVFHEVIAMYRTSFDARLSSLADRRRLKPAATSLLKYGLSPHAPHTVSEAVLNEIKFISRRRRLPLCMHVAESKDELQLLHRKKSGLEKLYRTVGWDISWAPEAGSPFEYLHRLGLLGPRLLAVHAVHATDRDISLIRKTRASIAHCPRSNRALNVGKMPLWKFLDAGITVGLGTDSLASSPSLNMWDEMRYALRIHKKDGVTAQDILRIATIGGAKALGLDDEIGSLEPGKKADIIAAPLPKKNTGDFYSDLLRETNSCIMSVVNGKIIHSS